MGTVKKSGRVGGTGGSINTAEATPCLNRGSTNGLKRVL